jgi:drug/metabolite transporter (DMT)-like permease
MNASTSSRSPSARGVGMALGATGLLSTTAILIRFLTERQLPPLVLAFWREVFVATALFVILTIFRPRLLRLPRQHLPFLVGYGFILMLFNSIWSISVALNGAALSTVMAYSSPAFTALIGRLLWREPLGPFKILAILVSLAGCTLVSGALDPALWALNTMGIVLGFTAGLLYAIYSIMGQETSNRGLNTWSALAVTFACAAAFLLVVLQFPLNTLTPALSHIGTAPDLLWLGADWLGWGVLLALAWGPTLGGYGLYNASLNHLPASVVNLIATLEPPMTAGLAYLLLGERLTTIQLVGSALIISGVMLLRVDALHRRRSLPVASPTL